MRLLGRTDSFIYREGLYRSWQGSCEHTEHLCRENDKTFITGEEVICIIYAVFSTIISDIRERLFLRAHFPPVFSHLIDGKINLISFIYLREEKLMYV